MSELRPHLQEREAYLDRLAQHYGDGLLDDAGFNARRDLLLEATSHAQMLRAFDGMPQPRYAPRKSSGVGRRGLLIGTAAVGGIVGLGAATAWLFGAGGSAADEFPQDDEWYGSYDEDVVEGINAVDFDLITVPLYALQERGFTLISEYTVGVEGAVGTAMSPRLPGELRAFQQRPARPLVIAEAAEGEVPPAVELEQLLDLLLHVLDQAPMDIDDAGVVNHLELVFTDRGNPTVVATMVDDVGTIATAQYDVGFTLIALEENQ